MNPIRLLVLLAATLFAGPFHVGASWEWRIFDPSGKEVGYRIARVVDSVDRPEEERVEWIIEVADSMPNSEPESLTLLERIDVARNPLRREWKQPTTRFPVPVGPFPDEQSFMYVAIGQLRRLNTAYPSWDVETGAIPGFLEFSEARGEGGTRYSLPIMNWDESTGWSHIRWVNYDHQLSYSDILDWILVKKDGKKVPVPPQAFHLPHKDDVWVWERKEARDSTVWTVPSPRYVNFMSRQTIRVVIDSIGEDLHGSVQIHARKIIVDSVSDPESIFVQWGPDSIPKPKGLDCDALMEGFRSDWLDLRSGDSRVRYFQSYSGTGYGTSHEDERFVQVRSSGGVDSQYCADRGSSAGGAYSTTVAYRLLSVNDSVIRAPAWTGVRSRSGLAKVPFDLREFAKVHPGAAVKIVGADGRQRTRMARDLFGSGQGISLSVGWFEVRLPDGSVQQGSFTR